MRTRLWAGRALALAGILLVALSLRTPVAALSPILDRIAEDIPLDPLVLGVIGAAPPLAFVASGLLAPGLARGLGLERALVVALAVMMLGHLGRALAPEAGVLTLASVVTFVGVGVGNVLLPPAVRRYFPDRVGLVTSLYATLLSVSTAVPALVAVPVADAAGWRLSLAIWFLVAAVAAVPWVAILLERRPVPAVEVADDVRTGPIELGAIELGDAQSAGTEAAVERPDEQPPARLGARLMRSPTAWAIAVVFGSSSLAVYACFAWLPTLLTDEAGIPDASAGALLALYAFMGFPAGLLIPVVTARFPRSSAWLALLGAVFFVAGYLGLLLAPAAAPALWVVLAGSGPLLFPLALVLINLRSSTSASTIALSGFVQTAGYVLGASGPFAVALLHDASGGWTWPLVFLLAVVVLVLPAAGILARNRTVDMEI